MSFSKFTELINLSVPKKFKLIEVHVHHEFKTIQTKKKCISISFFAGVESSQAHLNTAIHTKRIIVSTQGVQHISCLTSNKIWVSDLKQIGEIDEDGEHIMKLDVDFGGFGRHTVTREENLIFLMNGSVYILTSNGDIRNLNISASESSCIHASRLNGDIFVGAPNGVNRYSVSSKNLFQIQVENKIVDLYRRPIYITENKNGDIIVSDKHRKAIVVVDKQGRHRFNYKGNNSSEVFYPRGICTDVIGNILVCNHSYHDPSVYLLDENGQYLRTLLTKHRSVEDLPQDVCVDDKYNLYVACRDKNIIHVYTYLK